uniref:Uncharacterized protein n=1 Tax=Strongyloides venezuelensis TaxID=75913 RepID=A0A0K0FC14_STRVS
MYFSNSRERTHNNHDDRTNRIHGNVYNHLRGTTERCYQDDIEEKYCSKRKYYKKYERATSWHFDDNSNIKIKYLTSSAPNINSLSTCQIEKNRLINDKNIQTSEKSKKVKKKKMFKIISEPEYSPDSRNLRYLDQKRIK